ncbi:MAG: protein kinase [Planctomycetaceae bacterium]|nr:protein kinase [Planctomycetaceae bacterium]
MKSCCLAFSRDTLRRLAVNDLSPDELREVEQHVDSCHECMQLLEVEVGAQSADSEIIQSLAETIESIPALVADELLDLGPSTASLLRMLGPTDDPNMLGRIGNYEVAAIIGRGGMGVVFKAFDRSLHRYVAIKMLLPHLAESAAARKRFAREAKAAAAVVDDHVMPIHGVAEWNGMPYILSPYCRGVTLEKRIRDQGPLEIEEVLRIGMQTAQGLAAAHSQGLVHRDVKPGNILLDEGVERVQLTDFGLARTTDDVGMTRTGVLAGTPQFMSPEQTRGEAVDARSDLFALGSVLYTMCVGQPPFRGSHPLAVMQKIANEKVPSVGSLSPAIPQPLARLIDRLLEKRPQHRVESAAKVAEMLRDLLAQYQRGALPKVRRLPRTSLVIGVVGVALVAALVVASFWPNRLPPGSVKSPIPDLEPSQRSSVSSAAPNWVLDRVELDEAWRSIISLEQRAGHSKSHEVDPFDASIDRVRNDLDAFQRRLAEWAE